WRVVRVARGLADCEQGDFQTGAVAEFAQLFGNGFDAPSGMVLGDVEDNMAGFTRGRLLGKYVGNQHDAVRYQPVLDAEFFQLGGSLAVAHRNVDAVLEVAFDGGVDQGFFAADFVTADTVVHHLITRQLAFAQHHGHVGCDRGEFAAQTDELMMADHIGAVLDRVVDGLRRQVADDAVPLRGQAFAASDHQHGIALLARGPYRL